MNPRHIPFVRLLVPWLAGILAGAALNRPVAGLGYGLLAGAGVLLVAVKWRYAYRFRWVFGSLAGALVAGLAYFHAVRQDDRHRSDHFARMASGGQVFVGTVYDAPAVGAKVKVPLRVEAAGPAPDSLRPCSGNLLLLIETGPEAESLRYGDRLFVQASPRPTSPPGNPEAFDYQRYLHFQHIHYQAFVKEKAFKVIATGSGHPLWRMAFRWREQLLAVLSEHFPGRDEYAVASALLVGYKGELSDELRSSYAETGSMHALAVSGTHVGLLYAGLMFLLRRLPWKGRYRRWGETVLVLSGIWAFTLVTGATPSVLRAGVMFSAYVLGKAIRRQASVWNILAASAFLLLWIDPYTLFDAGFQLSYSAVAGMVFFYPALQKRSPTLPKWAAEGWTILLIGVAAQLGTLPLSLYYFHQFPVYFWLAGWVVVLGGAVFLWGGSVLVFLSAVAPGIAAGLGWLLYQLVWGMNQAIRFIQHLPGSVLPGIWLSAWATVALYIFIYAFGYGCVHYKSRWVLLSLVLPVLLCGDRAFRVFHQLHRRSITVYQVNRHFLLDFFDGDQAFVRADSMSLRQEKFAAQEHRLAKGIRNRTVLPVEGHFQTAGLQFRPPLVRFYSKSLLLIGESGFDSDPPDSADVLILYHNPPVRLPEFLKKCACREVVLDASNSPGRNVRWKAECRALGQPVHDVREQGAWEHSF